VDVLLTENLFGDILSDEAAVLAGSLGMLPSASLGQGPGLYEPVHGSAPPLAGKDVANPIGAIASGALLLRYSLGQEEAARTVEASIEAVLAQGFRTGDIAQGGEAAIGTREMGRRIAEGVAAGVARSGVPSGG
jgi:3-isopropylmalate dehydrogenase